MYRNASGQMLTHHAAATEKPNSTRIQIMLKFFPTQSIFGLALLGVLTMANTVAAQPSISTMETAQRINSANELVRQGEFETAIQQYEQVNASAEDQDELNYNLAVARYRSGDLESAKTLFTEAARSTDSAIAANSRYNLGNCLYSSALTTAEQDKPAAIEQLRQAISHYRASLRESSADNGTDARTNIELAAKLMKTLKEHQQQEHQQQEQQQQEQQQQDQQNQPSESENQSSEDSKSQDQSEPNQESEGESQSDQQQSDAQEQDDSKSAGEQPQQQPSKSEDSQSEDSQSEDSQNANSEQESDKNNSENSSTEEQPADAKPESESNSRSTSEQNPDPTSQQQTPSQQQSQAAQPNEPEPSPTDDQQNATEEPIPAGQLTTAGEEDENGKPTGAVEMADPNGTDGLMTKEEALKMLQAVRDRDMLRRMRQQRLEQSRHIPVDRDW